MYVRKYLSVRAYIMQKPFNWYAVRIIWLVPVWGGFLLEGVSEQTLVVKFFVNIVFIIVSILMSQDYRRVQMFSFYLFMPIDGVSWRARLGIFNAFKFQTQVKANMNNALLFLKIFLFFIYYIYARLIYLISFSTFRSTNILQLVDVEILFLLYIKIWLYCCGDIEINPVSKR